MNFTNEQLAKAKQAKSADELLVLAKENGIALSEEEATKFFAELHKDGEIADDELENVSGGCGDPYTEIDHDVEVLYIDNEDSSPYGMIVNYACHCDCVGGTEISADYPGVMRQTLRRFYGEDFRPVFINGFCGNINHAAPDGHHQVQGYFRQMGKWLAEDVIQLRENALTGQEQKALAQPMIDARTANVTIPSRLPDEALVTWAEGIKQRVDQCGEAAVDEMSLHFYKRSFDC